MRVMLFSDTFPPQVNGVATSAHNLARSLTEQGHSVMVCTVLARHPRHAPAEEPFPVVRMRAVSLPLYSDFSLAAPINLSLSRIVRRFQPDVIHCHTPFSIGWQGVRAAHAYNIPLVGTHHTLFGEYVDAYSRLGRDVNQRLATLIRRYVAAFYNQCTLTTSASRFLANDLVSGGMQRRVLIVPNPVDTLRFHPTKRVTAEPTTDEGVRLVYFGRLAAEKNLPRLLQLVEPVLQRTPSASFDIVGDGPVMPTLVAQVRQSGLEQQVRFTGWLRGDALAAHVASSDICLSASLTENQPMALLESLASGIPVVALAAAGVPEIIQDGYNGFLVDPDDTSGRFASRVEQLIQDAALRRKMSRHAHESAQQYTRAACLHANLTAYQDAIEAAPTRRRERSTRWLRPNRLIRRLPRRGR